MFRFSARGAFLLGGELKGRRVLETGRALIGVIRDGAPIYFLTLISECIKLNGDLSFEGVIVPLYGK